VTDRRDFVPPFSIRPYGFQWLVVDADGDLVESVSTLLRSSDSAMEEAQEIAERLNAAP
jgi:hypothetical protein